jgi:hypothetical protein
VLLAVLLAACGSLDSSPPTLTPTWAFSGPTLEATRPPLEARPTERPLGLLDLPGQNNPTAAALPADSRMPPRSLGAGVGGEEVVQIPLTRDDAALTGVLYENPTIQLEDRQIASRLPGILILGASDDAWGDFPDRLRAEGFTVLVVNMGFYQTAGDFIDVIDAMSRLGTVDPGSIGVIGAGQGADHALIGCAVEELCDAVVLLSPLVAETLVNVMPDYNPRPIYIAASDDDTSAYDTAQRVAMVAAGEIQLELLSGAGRSTQMLTTTPELADAIAAWLVEHLIGL